MTEEQSTAQATQTRRVTLKVVTLPEAITVGNLAQRIHSEPILVVKQLMRMNVFANVTQVIDFDTAAVALRAFGYSARKATETAKAVAGAVAEEDASLLKPRPPVVTILGHVDHGKTTLLDAIRRTNVVAREAGGITQHIGAYQVDYNGHPITFLDTPGHQAFTAMRARGAQVTDVAVLVVAADDGVMPQTEEAIDHIKAAGVPIIVAINKMDAPGADAERVKRQLSEHQLVVEEWGGEVIAVPVSAKQRTGIEDLLESILVVTEVAELKANPDRPAMGVVIEAEMDKSRGPVTRVLVQTGTLKVGDNLVVGTSWGRVKALTSDTGRRLKSAGPATPVEVLGISVLPAAGDRFIAAADEHAARELAAEHQRSAQASRAHGVTLEDFRARAATAGVKEMNLILKTDVQGSIGAIQTALDQLASGESRVRVIHAATGSINESDVMLAVASQAVIIGFNARPEPGARRLADQDGVDIRYYDIIYRLTDDIQAALAGMLEVVAKDVVEGRLEVRAVYPLGKTRASAGCYVTEGQIARGAMARVMRGGKQVFDGPIASLRRFKDDVRQVAAGYECGVTLDGFNDYVVGDTIEAHRQQRAGQAS
jgi:translation initiation factor IF-2